MRHRIYQQLVNRVPGIRDRYLQKRARTGSRPAALLYLVWLNIQYYVLFRRSLNQPLDFPYYEEKKLYSAGSESSLSYRMHPDQFAEKLAAYDIVSFDVFDTLILRALSDPTDVFFLVGMALNCPDFKRIRIECEKKARQKKHQSSGTYEVTLAEIWALVEQETGIEKDAGMQTEMDWERRCCLANPYMLQVVEELCRLDKKLVATSDMYLPRDFIYSLLSSCGYRDFGEYFVSNDQAASKHDGRLFDVVRNTLGPDLRYAHVGDNDFSDNLQAAKHGFTPFPYPNPNLSGNKYRSRDMSVLTGSVYRAIVNNRIHNGTSLLSRQYEYGFVYGGLFVTGFCRFIHDYAAAHGIEKLLFLSRDGAVLIRAYHKLYPDEKPRTQYVYWSRLAAVKLSAGHFRADYFRRFLDHRTNQGISIRRIVADMELDDLLASLCESAGIHPDNELTNKNAEMVKKYLIEAWPRVLEHYRPQLDAAAAYFHPILDGCKSAAAVDVGWAGSGGAMLDCVVNRIWNLGCRVTTIVAGTDTSSAADRDAWEIFSMKNRRISYLYSQTFNRDLWKFHNPAKRHNLFWELLLGAPEGSLIGFYPDEKDGFRCRFKELRQNPESIREIHNGVLDFVDLFLQIEKRLGLTIPISGRDAYAPMLNVLSRKNKSFTAGLEELLDETSIR